MTDNNHPMLPTQEQLTEWDSERFDEGENFDVMMIKAFQAGADQELEACRLWVSENCDIYSAVELIQFRRPKPVSLQDQALDDLERIAALLMRYSLPCDTGNIRRALESLP